MRPLLVPWPRAAAGVVGGATVAFFALGFLVRGDDHGLAIDNAFDRWIHQHFDVYARHDMVQLTDGWAIAVAVAVIASFPILARRYDLAALTVLAPLLASGLTEYVFKPFFGRTVPLVVTMTGIETEAYPSGHETAVSSVLVLLGLLLLRARLPVGLKIAGLVALTGYYVITVFGLVGQYFHYLTDTIGALCLALAVVLGGALLVDKIRVRTRAGD